MASPHSSFDMVSASLGGDLGYGCICELHGQGQIPTKTEGGRPAVSWIQPSLLMS